MADKLAKKSTSSTPTTQHVKKGNNSTPTTQHVKKGSSSIPTTHHVKKSSSSPPTTDRDKEIYRLCLKNDLDDSKKKAIWDKLYRRNDTKVTEPPTLFREPAVTKASRLRSIERRITITNMFSDMDIQAAKKTNSDSSNADSETQRYSEIERVMKMKIERIPTAATQHQCQVSIKSFPLCEIEEYVKELNKTKSNNLHVDKSMQKRLSDLIRFTSDKASHHHHHVKDTRKKSSEPQKANITKLNKN